MVCNLFLYYRYQAEISLDPFQVCESTNCYVMAGQCRFSVLMDVTAVCFSTLITHFSAFNSTYSLQPADSS